MKSKNSFAVGVIAVLLLLPACNSTRHDPLPSAAVQQYLAVDPAHNALTEAGKLFEQLDYEGVIQKLSPYETSKAGDDGVRLKQLLGAAHYLTGHQEAAARVFRACPLGGDLDATESSPSLRAFYQRNAGKE